jgi:UrcA family protein
MVRFLLAGALLAGAVQAPAFADSRVIVSYDPAALSTAKGRQALDRRVARAVIRVCGDGRVTGSVLISPEVRKCRETAAAAARPQVERAIALAVRPTDVASR